MTASAFETGTLAEEPPYCTSPMGTTLTAVPAVVDAPPVSPPWRDCRPPGPCPGLIGPFAPPGRFRPPVVLLIPPWRFARLLRSTGAPLSSFIAPLMFGPPLRDARMAMRA